MAPQQPPYQLALTPQQLTDDLTALSDELRQRTGNTEVVFPERYFNWNVYSIDPRGVGTQRSPKHCATMPAATALARLLAADSPIADQNQGVVCSGIAVGNAIRKDGLFGSFNDTEAVPYLAFGPIKDDAPTGPFVNAGLLMDYLNHGAQVRNSWPNLIAEIKAVL